MLKFKIGDRVNYTEYDREDRFQNMMITNIDTTSPWPYMCNDKDGDECVFEEWELELVQ